MDELASIFERIALGDGESGGGDVRIDAETQSETFSEGGFASADVADEFDEMWWGDFFSKVLTKIDHFLL